jgi:CRP/FNR family cyclic AMP-dependent transcriptional regulator
MRRQPTPSPKAARLRALPPFAGCSTAELEDLAGLVEESCRPAGATLTRQGGLGLEVFVIVEGEVDITRDGVHVATLSAGDVLGELALLGAGARTATATCRTDTSFLVVGAHAFPAVLDRPTVGRAIRRAAAARVAAGRAPRSADRPAPVPALA